MLHNNAQQPIVGLTQEKIEKIQWKVMEKPLLNPGRSPCEYHMFSPLKEGLGSHHFDENKGMEIFVGNWIELNNL